MLLHFWYQIVAFYFLQFINVWISVMMVIFHTLNALTKVIKSRLLLRLFLTQTALVMLMGLSCDEWTTRKSRWLMRWTNRFSFWLRMHWLKRVKYKTNSTTEHRILHMCDWTNHSWDDLFLPSHIKDLFKMNESFKNDPSLNYSQKSEF